MTPKQQRFCDEYLIDCNARRAYKAVYTSIKNDNVADANASRLLSNAKVKSYIDEQLQKIEDSKIADVAEVMKYLTSVMRGESQASVVVVEGCGEGVSQARTVIKQPDEKERLKAAELIGKRYGAFTDKVQNEVIIPVFGGEDQLED